MTKGTTSQGPKHYKCHVLCRRCGKKSFHNQRRVCSSCGYPDKCMRKYLWCRKSHGRRTTGTGRCSYLKSVWKKQQHSFKSKTQTKVQKSLNAFAARRA